MKNFDFNTLKVQIKYLLIYPSDILLTRKTGPGFLGISLYAFDKLRKQGVFCTYVYKGVYFFDIEEVLEWKKWCKSIISIPDSPVNKASLSLA